MAFRIVEISRPAEIHIKSGQLEIAQEEGTVLIPIEDIYQIIAHGPNIRLSTMDLSILAENKVCLTVLGNKYLPTAITMPMEGNARQSRLIHQQAETPREKYEEIWQTVIRRKISNQARALSILGREGAEKIDSYIADLNVQNVLNDRAEMVYHSTILCQLKKYEKIT